MLPLAVETASRGRAWCRLWRRDRLWHSLLHGTLFRQTGSIEPDPLLPEILRQPFGQQSFARFNLIRQPLFQSLQPQVQSVTHGIILPPLARAGGFHTLDRRDISWCSRRLPERPTALARAALRIRTIRRFLTAPASRSPHDARPRNLSEAF